MNPEQIRQVLLAIDDTCDIAVIALESVEKALQLQERYGFSYYDSLIIASALENGCKYLFSEDMQDGQVIDDSLEIVNIFNRLSFVK